MPFVDTCVRDYVVGCRTLKVMCRRPPHEEEASSRRDIGSAEEEQYDPTKDATDTIGWDIWLGATQRMLDLLADNTAVVTGGCPAHE